MRNSFTSDRTARPGDKGDEFGDRKSYLQSPYWWAGIILMCLGETGNFMAYGFAPASIVSPLGVVALISNCVIAPCLLKETFRQRDFWGVLIAIAGAVVVVLSAKSSEEKIGPDEIWAMITTWEFETYLGLTTGLIIAFMWASFRYGSRSILIDVGLVALFGESPVPVLVLMRPGDMLTKWDRRIYRTLHQGCFFTFVIYIMARHYLPHHLFAGLCPRLQRSHANPLYQSGLTAI
jgi:drug/metabolite transporter (DMT)-like permease